MERLPKLVAGPASFLACEELVAAIVAVPTSRGRELLLDCLRSPSCSLACAAASAVAGSTGPDVDPVRR